MIEKITSKIRNLINDKLTSDTETYEAGSGRTFTIGQENTASVSGITVNATALTSEEYSYDSTNQVATIIEGKVVEDDIVVISYKYYKYSDADLLTYIKSSLDWMDTFNYKPHFYISSDDADIYPIPKGREQSLIAVIVSILIQPYYTEKRLPNVVIKYPKNQPKEKVIEKLIAKFKICKEGVIKLIDLSNLF